MRIQPGQLNIYGAAKLHAGNSPFTKSQIIRGKILSMLGNELDIVFEGGACVKAAANGHIDLPINKLIHFQVVENTGDRMLLRPVPDGVNGPVFEERNLAALAHSLGLEPSQSNIDFLKSCQNIVGQSLAKLITLLQADGRADIIQKLQQVFIRPDNLLEYLTGFERQNFENLIERLSKVFESMEKYNLNNTAYNKVMTDIIKGLAVQINNHFPIFYIPLPLIFNNSFFPSEVWIEKDGQNKRGEENIISIRLIADTPLFGRVEAAINSTRMDVSIEIYCSKEFLTLFSRYSAILKERIERLDVNLKSLDFKELQKNSGFPDLSQKYLESHPPLDIKI